MIEKKKIEATVNDWISDPSVFMVEVKTDRENNIRVFMDADNGFGIEQCVALTKYIESVFDRDIEDYQLTVSSYGITQPLLNDRQFRKYVGRNIEVDPLEGKPFKGKLVSYSKGSMTIERTLGNKERKAVSDTPVTLGVKDVKTVKPAISFN